MLSFSGSILNELNVYETFVSYIMIVWGLPTSKSYVIINHCTLNSKSAGLDMKACPSNFLPYTIYS